MTSSLSDSGSKHLVPIFVITWALFFAFGTIGHLQLGNSLVESLFKTLQLFHLHYHPFPDDFCCHEKVDIPIALDIARFGGGLWALTLLPALIGIFFQERLRLWWIRRIWRNHYIVCGECSRSLSLVRDLRSEGKKVVIIGTCKWVKNSLPGGVVHFDGDSADPVVLQKAVVNRAAHIIAIHENDRANIETLIAAGKLCTKRPLKMLPIEAHAHISDIHLQSSLHHVITTRGGLSLQNVKENFFNYYELIARLFARNFPLPASFSELKPNPVHIIIVGFGAFGQNVALKTIKMAQQLCQDKSSEPYKWKVCKPRITIVDPFVEVALKPFLRSYPDFNEFCELEVLKLSTMDDDFQTLKFIKNNPHDAKTSLVFCLENESVTMSALATILDISRIESKTLDHIYIRIAQPDRMKELLDNIQPRNKRPEIIYFASDKEIFNADVLLNRSLDAMAKTFHDAWLGVEANDRRLTNLPPAANQTWESLSEDDRQSNREAADHTWAKLRILGYKIIEFSGKNPSACIDPSIIEDIKKNEEDLARFEHYRWMVWRILHGWKQGSPRNNTLKLHPDLVEYEKLNEPTKEKDRANIRAIQKLIVAGKLTVVK